MGYLKSTGTTIIYIGFFLAVITFVPGLPPFAEFSEYSITPPKELPENLKSNNRLNNAEILFANQIKGPESFDSYNGELYSGTHGGLVVKIEDKRFVPIVSLGKPCDGIAQQHICGRPLGLKFNKNGDLFVVDTYQGIFQVDVKTGKHKKVIDTSLPINDKVPACPNSIDIASNGDIYWTDSSAEFPLYDGLFTLLANPSGRLFRYNAATKKNQVLLQNLGFANGLRLSDDESYLIVAETLTSRLIKYHLKGSKAGKSEIFIEGLPGLPDNIHSDNNGGFLVSLVVPADPEHPVLPQVLIPHPLLRKMLARLLAFLECPFKFIQKTYPNYYSELMVYYIGSLEITEAITPDQVSVLRIDGQGKIIDVMHASDDRIKSMSSAYMHDGYLYLGSPYNNYLARVPLKQALPGVPEPKVERKKRETQPKTVPTTTAAPPKATTTTPKPTTTTTTTTTPKPMTTPKPTTTAPKATAKATPTTTTTTATPKPTTTTTTPKPSTAAPPKAVPTKPTVAKVKESSKPAATKPKPVETPKKASSEKKENRMEEKNKKN